VAPCGSCVYVDVLFAAQGSKLHKPVVTFEEVDAQLVARGESLTLYQDLFRTLCETKAGSASSSEATVSKEAFTRLVGGAGAVGCSHGVSGWGVCVGGGGSLQTCSTWLTLSYPLCTVMLHLPQTTCPPCMLCARCGSRVVHPRMGKRLLCGADRAPCWCCV
jgi:hypothetical protein